MTKHTIWSAALVCSSLVTQGCATLEGITRDAIANGQPQSPVSDPFRRRGDDPSMSVFGTRRLPTNVPTNLPLPPQANPARMFEIKSPRPEVVTGALAVFGGIVLYTCALDELNGHKSRQCDATPRGGNQSPEARKPTINR